MESPNGAALLDDSPSPSPIPRQSPPTTPRVPFFSGSPLPQPPEESQPEPGSPDLGSVSDPDWPDESAPSGNDSPTPTRVSNPLNGDGLKDVLRGAVLIAGDQAHGLLARTPGQQAVELYKVDEDDAAAIADPLARVAARREGIGDVSPDTADLLAAMVGLTRYATKQITKSRDARELDAAGAVQQPVDL